MNKSKTLLLFSFIGSLLIFAGLSGPWLSYSAKWSFYANETSRYHGKTFAEVSPFLINYTLSVTSSTSLDPGPIREIIPLKIFLGEDKKFLYDPLASLLGLSCAVGAIIGVTGQYRNKWSISFFGGLLSLLSTISFFITLPRNINVLNLSVLSHWYFTSAGAILIIVCSTFDFIQSFLRTILDFIPLNT